MTSRRALTALLICASWALPSAAQTPPAAQPHQAIYQYKGADRDARLLELARKEGTLTLYTSMAPTESKPLADAFEKKTGVKVEIWRAVSGSVLQRALSEARGKRNIADVVETNAPEMESLAREQVLSPFHSPYLADLPQDIIPKHGQWVPDRLNFFVVAFNTNKVKAADLPKTFEGFTDPKWKGRISIESTDSEWMAGLYKVWGEARAAAFFKKIAEMKPDMRKGHVLLAQLIASGEIEVGLTAYHGNAVSFKKRGAPLDWAPVEPVIARPQGVGVAREAPHPHAALLFADYILSPEAQEMLNTMGRTPTSRKVKSDASGMSYVLSDPVVILDESDKWEQVWDKTLMGK